MVYNYIYLIYNNIKYIQYLPYVTAYSIQQKKEAKTTKINNVKSFILRPITQINNQTIWLFYTYIVIILPWSWQSSIGGFLLEEASTTISYKYFCIETCIFNWYDWMLMNMVAELTVIQQLNKWVNVFSVSSRK